jgi:hypothetical protein
MTQLSSTRALAAVLAVCFALSAASMASAQGKKPSRETVMHRCLVATQSQYPDVNTEQAGRVAVYKACMTKAGYRP